MFIVIYTYTVLTMVLVTIIASLFAIKLFIKTTTGVCRNNCRLDGKTVIVTGGNSGIGYEAAKEFARRGARVIIACRDIEKGEKARDEILNETYNANVACKYVDFSSLTSVRAFAKDILANEPKLHILVNNAGAGGLGNHKSEDGLQIGLQVNHFGPFLLTNLLLGKLRASAPSKVIMVSAWGHKLAKVDLDDINMESKWRETLVYCNSKLGNVIVANEISRRLAGYDVTANSLHPGIVMTGIFRNIPYIIRAPLHFIINWFFKTPYEGAQTIIYLAVSPEVEYVGGEYFVDCKKSIMSTKAKDIEFAQKFWEKSEKCVGLQPYEKHYL